MSATGIRFSEAIQALQSERQSRLRSHPTIADLEAYHRERLTPAERRQIADHLTQCEDCTIVLLVGVMGTEGGPGQQQVPDDTKVEKAWRRLSSRLQLADEPEYTLASLLREGPLAHDRALWIALEVTNTLARLHFRGRVLADLRSENVEIRNSGEVHLVDIGIAPTPETFEVGYGHPAEDVVLDLYRSLSPEQVIREQLTARSNLFSLGVLFYELFAGVSPFRDTTPLATASRILSFDPAPVNELNSAVTPALSQLIDRLLAKEPRHRPADATAVADELSHIVSGNGSSSNTQSRALSIDEEIDHLYDRIAFLAESCDDETAPERDLDLERAYERLLELETAEAAQFRRRFEASLEMPIDAGEQILARARKLRDELEDLAASHSTADNPDSP